MNLIKVAAASRTSAVAGAIAGVVREHHRAEVQAIGAAAVNQALKALILATGYLNQDGIQVCFTPEFADVTIDDNVKTAIKLVVEPQHSAHNIPGSKPLAVDVARSDVAVDPADANTYQ